MEEAVLARLGSWWRVAAGQKREAEALARLCVHLADLSAPDAALFLVRHALDLDPAQLDALALLEQLAPTLERTELCRRYEAFLSKVPSGPYADHVREQLIARLFSYDHHYSALRHVDDLLDGLTVDGPTDTQIAHARAVLREEQPPRFDLASIDRELDDCERLPLCEAAE